MMNIKNQHRVNDVESTETFDDDELDVREERKRVGRERIAEVARELFQKRGYERTTLRAIAVRAKVSAATVVNYFGDKQELLAVIFDEAHRPITALSLAQLSDTKDFLRQSIDGFRPYFEFFAKHHTFAASVIWSLPLYDPERRTPTVLNEVTDRQLDRIRRTLDIARHRGEINIDEDDDELALFVLEIYQAELRRWLATPKPDAEVGLVRLRRALGIAFNGMAPVPVPLPRSRKASAKAPGTARRRS